MQVGDIVFLERAISGLPYPTGYWVICQLTDATMDIAMVSGDKKGLYAIDNWYTVSTEDLGAFTKTSETARIRK